MITAVSQILLPVTDQDAANHFWTRVIGFEPTTDAPYGVDQRWIEVTPPAGRPALVLGVGGTETAEANSDGELPDSPVFFTCDNVERTHRELIERGVRFTTPPQRHEFGWWAVFEDHEGRRYALGSD